MSVSSIDLSVLKDMKCNTGESLEELSSEQLVMLVFLRHFGCVFCKEALSDLSEAKKAIEQKGARLVFVHMAPDPVADNYFKKYKLSGSIHISNPNKTYYAAFGLMKGSISQLYGLRTWIRGFSARKDGYQLELAQELGDSTQMPGIFLIYDKQVLESYIHRNASDRPDYLKLAGCCKNLSRPANG